MLGKGSRFFDHLKRTSTSRPTGRTGQDANQGQSSVNQGPGPPTSVLAATPIPKAAPSPEPSAPTTVPQQIWNEALARLQDFKDGKQAHSVIFEKLANHAGSQEEGDVSQYAADVCERLCSIRDAQSRHSSRGIYEKVIGILDRFIVFEDTGVMLPWAAVRFVLIISEDLTLVVSLFARCALYMKLYFPSDVTELASMEPNGPLSRLKSVIISVYRHSLLFLGYMIQVHGKAQILGTATAAFRLPTVDKYLQALRDSDKDLSQAASDSDKTVNLEHRTKHIQDIQAALGDITKLHKTLQNFIDFMYGYQILASLKPVDTAAYDQLSHNEVVVCHPETRVDLLRDIQKWVDEGPLPSAYWVSGLAGTGKSTIARTVADRLESKGQLGGSFFFKGGQGDRANGRKFFATIAYQLARRIPFWYNYLAELLGAEQDIASKSIEVQFKRLIQEPCEQEPAASAGPQRHSRDLILVIDAIDECDPSDVSLIIPLLMSTKLRHFFTGRPEFRIKSLLRDWEKRQLVLHKLDEAVTKQDIRIYLAYRLAICRDKFNKAFEYDDFRLPLHWPSDEMLDRLAELANPLFIAAATICRMAEADSTMKDPAEIAQDLLANQRTGLKAVDMIYTQVLRKLDLASHQDSEMFRRIVGSIILVFDPLIIQSLSRLLRIHEKRIHQCLNQLQAILDSSDRGAPIKPFHLSLRDFLLGSEAPSPVRINERLGHRELARCCNSLLMDGLKKDICGVEAPGFSRQSLTAEQIEHRIPLELQYACLYWVSHLKASGDLIVDGDDAHKLLQMKALMLFEALSWMDRLPEAERMVNELQALTKQGHGAQLSQLLQASMRFLSTFNSGIQEAPLQVYHSGLAFTPLDTILGRIYSDLCSSVWNVQSPIDKSHWDSTLRRFDCDGEIVDCVTFSNDGRLASGSRRGIIRVWSPSSGDLLCKLEWTDHSIQYLAFSPEGQLASLSSTSIRVWDLDTRQPLQTIDPGQVQSPFSAVFSRCNAFLYYFHGIQSAYMYDWRKRQLLHVQHFHEAAYHTVLATNGDWLARCHSGRIRLSRWDDADTRQQHSELSFGGGGMYINLAFSSDTKLLAAKDLTGNILIWDVETCQLRHMFQMNPSWRRPMTFSQSYFLEGGENGTIYIYDLEKKALLQPIPAHSQKIGSLAFSDKHHMIVSTSRGGKCVKTWDPSNQEVFNAGTIAANKLSFGFGSEFLITPGSGCEAGLMNLRKGTSITAFPRHFRFLAVSEVTPLLACVGESSIEIWDTQQWSLKATLPLPGATADAACFSTDGTKLAISLKGSVLPLSLRRAELCIYNVDTQLCEWSIYPLHDDGVGSMALYTEGPVKVLAFATSRAMVCMTDISKGATTEYRSGASASVAFINGGTQLLMVDEKWGGSVIDTATGARLWHWPALATGARHTLLDMSFFKRVINLDKDLAPELQFAELINSRHISKDGSWIMEGTERVLWLPMQHRPRFAALSGSLLAISTETGGFLLLEHKE